MNTSSTSQDSQRTLRISTGSVVLEGDLTMPERARGIVLFAHGSGSNRYSPRNRFVAEFFLESNLATLMLDLLTPAEQKIDDQTRQLRFDIRLLADRLIGAADWLATNGLTRDLGIGYYGASTGAAAALMAAAARPKETAAVVSRGGRPDLAGDALVCVVAPTLLLVGENDPVVLDLNEKALRQLAGTKQLVIIPGATHLFEEPGALEEVARIARAWFESHLTAGRPEGAPRPAVVGRSSRGSRSDEIPYRNRAEAGRYLATKLAHYADLPNVIVLALPRGGLPVGFEVAAALHAPLDVFTVRKLGVPGHEELAMGAIASGGIRVINREVVDFLRISNATLETATRNEERELKRRERLYRDDRPPIDVAGHIVILVDDGLATGSTMRAAVAALRQQAPSRIVVAVPIAALATYEEFQNEVDEIVCAKTPETFLAVGLWYDDFSQTTDEEVHHLLARAQYAADALRP
ncbi:MAG: phosphoribosyltransferase family protein [Pirellulales bacterium]